MTLSPALGTNPGWFRCLSHLARTRLLGSSNRCCRLPGLPSLRTASFAAFTGQEILGRGRSTEYDWAPASILVSFVHLCTISDVTQRQATGGAERRPWCRVEAPGICIGHCRGALIPNLPNRPQALLRASTSFRTILRGDVPVRVSAEGRNGMRGKRIARGLPGRAIASTSPSRERRCLALS